jgi:hypothetical protein
MSQVAMHSLQAGLLSNSARPPNCHRHGRPKLPGWLLSIFCSMICSVEAEVVAWSSGQEQLLHKSCMRLAVSSYFTAARPSCCSTCYPVCLSQYVTCTLDEAYVTSSGRCQLPS